MKLGLIIFLFLSLTCKANWYKIDASGKVVAFSKYAKPGKISIFIIGAPWCGSCKILREDIGDAKLDMNLIDIYDVELTSPGTGLEQLKNMSAYNFWGKLESLTTLPRIYITTPTTNLVASFDDAGRYKNIYERIIHVINEIQENSNGFNTDLLLQPSVKFTSLSTIEKPNAIKPHNSSAKSTIVFLKNKMDSLQKVIALKQDSIILLEQHSDSLNNKIERFVLESEDVIKKYFGLNSKTRN